MAAAQVTATPDFQVGRNEERAAAVSAAFEAHYPRTLELLEREFPRDHADLIEALERVKNSFNSYPLDRLAIAGAVRPPPRRLTTAWRTKKPI